LIMKTTQLLLVASLCVLLGACSHTPTQSSKPSGGQSAADKAATTQATGTVTDSAAKPVAGATVEYWRYEENGFSTGGPELENKTTTGANGSFSIPITRGVGFMLAHKPGLAPAWKSLGQPFGNGSAKNLRLVLTPPGTLGGVVLDESNRPVAHVKVSVATAFTTLSRENGGRSFNSFNFFVSAMTSDMFSARTDAAGHFHIDNFPTNASATFEVEAPGKALRATQQDLSDPETAGYRAGQKDIQLIMEPAGSIEGKIVCGTNQTPPSARISLQSGERGTWMGTGIKPVRSTAANTFRFDNLADGSYILQAKFGTNGSSGWVAETVPVTVTSGQVTRDVKVMAQRGALLEVSVLSENNRKPQAKMNVSAYRENSQSSAVSDSQGVARLHLVPGSYQIMALRQSMPAASVSTTVEAGVTNRVEIEVAGPKQISGVVRGTNGQPASGIRVQLVGGYGPQDTDIQTDANGKFELEWNPRQFAGQSSPSVCVLVRDVEHNLAVAQDVDEDSSGALELKLAPALTLAGSAQAGGQPIPNATAQLVFWSGNRGSWLQGLAQTNVAGKFEIPALPPGRKYGVIVSAPGYGQKQNNNLEVSAEPGRQELDPVELKLANLKLAGQVLDADDKPVANCYVNMNGDEQPSGNARTDHDGRFHFAHVCEGAVRLSANSQRSFGSVSAEGGDTNVVLQLGQNFSNPSGGQTHKLKGVITDAEGKPAAGAQVAVFPSDNGTHWTKTGANGEYSLTWSVQPWRMQNGGAILLAFRDKARNLAGTEELTEDMTNLDAKLKPALTISGQVKNSDGAALAAAQITLWLKAGNSYDSLDQGAAIAVSPEGRFEIPCLPADAAYIIYASASGFGKHQQQLAPEYETNHLALETFVLNHADQIIAGQVLKDDDKPASGINVNLNGEDQPDGNMTTDSQGRFHFKVCAGQIRLFAYSQSGGGYANATADAGDTNIVLNLRTNPGVVRESPHRASLKGSPLPDLASANLAAEAAPAGQPVLLCLFDAGQRPSRHAVQMLEQQSASLRQKNVSVLGVQVAAISDETFNTWKTAGSVSFPVGRITEKSEKFKWAANTSTLPWLILADASHRVVAEGFPLDELPAQVEKLAK
jgi:protocatechuate 3,4-dioxygenase beta subunit